MMLSGMKMDTIHSRLVAGFLRLGAVHPFHQLVEAMFKGQEVSKSLTLQILGVSHFEVSIRKFLNHGIQLHPDPGAQY